MAEYDDKKPGVIRRLRELGYDHIIEPAFVNKEDAYWKVQESLKKPELQNNQAYLEWKRKRDEFRRTITGEEDPPVEFESAPPARYTTGGH